MHIEKLPGIVHHAIEEFETDLAAELGPAGADASWGPFRYVTAPERKVYWALNTWLEPFRVEFDSISEASSALRAIQRNWAPCLYTQFRRGALISDKLPPISAKPKPFPFLLPDSQMGAWTLLDEHTMIASARCSSPFPGGVVEFQEDKEGPPSRAYLKLREALVRLRAFPKENDLCLDAGSCPGGWTWVLAELGARVISVDRAEIDPRVAAMKGVEFRKHDAFTLKPEDVGPIDWFCSDVICYPPRLYDWVGRWLDSGLCRNFICTIKMQGNADRETTERFAAIPGSSVVHLHNNKHELTWMLVR
ncbi:MAG: SAM-dependent methyltransferase [Treponemataceae bacterium]